MYYVWWCELISSGHGGRTLKPTLKNDCLLYARGSQLQKFCLSGTERWVLNNIHSCCKHAASLSCALPARKRQPNAAICEAWQAVWFASFTTLLCSSSSPVLPIVLKHAPLQCRVNFSAPLIFSLCLQCYFLFLRHSLARIGKGRFDLNRGPDVQLATSSSTLSERRELSQCYGMIKHELC